MHLALRSGSSFSFLLADRPLSRVRARAALVSQHVVVETFEHGESVAEYLHKAGDSPKVTKWRRNESGDGWVPVDESQSLKAAFGSGGDDAQHTKDRDNIELREKVALVGVQSYLKMLMMDNFIHADLHPGNGAQSERLGRTLWSSPRKASASNPGLWSRCRRAASASNPVVFVVAARL